MESESNIFFSFETFEPRRIDCAISFLTNWPLRQALLGCPVTAWSVYGETMVRSILLGSYLLFFGLVSSHMHCLSAPKCGVFVTGCPSVWSFFATQVGSTRFVMLLFSSLLITVKLPGDGHPQPRVLLPLDLLPAKEQFWFWSCPIGQIRPPSLPVFCFCCHLLGNQLFHLRHAWQLAGNFCSANSVHLIN